MVEPEASASEFLNFVDSKGSEINLIQPQQNLESSTPRGFFTGENVLSDIEFAASNNMIMQSPESKAARITPSHFVKTHGLQDSFTLDKNFQMFDK